MSDTTRYLAETDADGVTLTLPAGMAVRLTRLELEAFLTAINLEYLARSSPWDDAVSPVLGGQEKN